MDRIAVKRARARFDREFRAEVWRRDQGRCRKCGRIVKKTLARVPDRGDVHHCYGRVGTLRYEDRCALLLCLADHALVTGTVNARWDVIGTKFVWVGDRLCVDCRYPVTFRKVV